MCHKTVRAVGTQKGEPARVRQVREQSWKRWKVKCKCSIPKNDGRFIPWKSTVKRESEGKRERRLDPASEHPKSDFKFHYLAFRTTWTSTVTSVLKVKIKSDDKAVGTMQDPQQTLSKWNLLLF